ncbi:hypothetical protein F5Y09DRAFT_62844 [Xylaria sp. FL1042]|nr:hypothetical protein F5Y09DRAFT_62844 [Xylaria sp. FL1042]
MTKAAGLLKTRVKNMDSTHSQQDGDGTLLPSTFSPGRSEGPADPANSSKSTTYADAVRPSVESAFSGNTPQSLAPSTISNSTPGRRGSSAFYSPQSLKGAPRAATEEPPAYAATPQNALSHSPSIRSAQTAMSVDPSEMEGQPSLSSSASGSGQSILAVSNVNAMRSASIMPTHPGAESIPMSAMYNPTPSPTTMVSDDEVSYQEGGAEDLPPGHAKSHSPFQCHSRKDVYIQRWSWLYVTLIFLSLYSTVFSGIWLGASIIQPRYGRGISTAVGWRVSPSTATLLSALGAKTIELSFVTVFVAVLGQVLTRRAFSRLSRGITLAEMTMRNWVIQPGSLLTHWDGIPFAATTFLGALTLSATICALFYTTASDAMVSPKLSQHAWEMRDLHGLVRTSYANPYYIKNSCQTPLLDIDPENAPNGCLDISFSGQSYSSLTEFLAEWNEIQRSNNSSVHRLSDRPTGKHILYDNTTMVSSWIETENGDITANFDAHKRIINNVTLAMPHAGVYAAATDPINGILQPSELLGIGEYSIRASVVSPVVNVLCVNMNVDELKPLVYTDWPNARKTQPLFPGQWIGVSDWQKDVPVNGSLNRTVVDDIFKWGEKYGRRPPAFQLYPLDYNMVTYFDNVGFPDAMYILAKPNQTLTDYTVCELRSWLTPKCSTTFDLSGTSGGHMKARCEDPSDRNAYERTVPEGTSLAPAPSGDWRNVAQEWQLALDFNGGVTTNNASNARLLTSLFPDKPELNPLLPSMAEGIAVLATSTLAASSIDSTFQPQWMHYKEGGNYSIINETFYETFRAEVQTQQYASVHTASWQAIFYPVLILVFVLNVLCLLYLAFGTTFAFFSTAKSSSTPQIKKKQRRSPSLPFPISFKRNSKKFRINTQSFHESYSNVNLVVNPENAEVRGGKKGFKAAKGLVTDYTEPQNLFALAINSTPSSALAGSCGHGPNTAELRVPWRVGYAAAANHYYFEECERSEVVEKEGGANTNVNINTTSSGATLLSPGSDGSYEYGPYGKNYQRLSSSQVWL